MIFVSRILALLAFASATIFVVGCPPNQGSACKQDSDCPSVYPVCLIARGTCAVAQCTIAAECAATDASQGRICTTSDSECGEGERCVTGSAGFYCVKSAASCASMSNSLVANDIDGSSARFCSARDVTCSGGHCRGGCFVEDICKSGEGEGEGATEGQASNAGQ